MTVSLKSDVQSSVSWFQLHTGAVGRNNLSNHISMVRLRETYYAHVQCCVDRLRGKA